VPRRAVRAAVRVPSERAVIRFDDAVSRAGEIHADIEDFALLRSDGMPTYHLHPRGRRALGISHIIRGQDHLTNTFSTS